MGYGKWLHGEAVAAGMVMAADLSQRCGQLDASAIERIKTANLSAELPVAGPSWPADRYIELMAVDKKASRGIPRFVLLNGLGQAELKNVDENLVRETLLAHATLK